MIVEQTTGLEHKVNEVNEKPPSEFDNFRRYIGRFPNSHELMRLYMLLCIRYYVRDNDNADNPCDLVPEAAIKVYCAADFPFPPPGLPSYTPRS